MSKRNRPVRHQSSTIAVAAASGAAPSTARMGGYEGAGDSLSMMNWNPVAGSADADLLPDLQTLTARSRDLKRNNGLMAGGMQTYRDNIVGATLRLSAKPDAVLLGWSREKARQWANITEAKFRTWFETSECDAARTLNGLGLTLQALGGAIENGDALALPLWLPRAGLKWGTRLQMVESDRLRTPMELSSRDNIRGGIEFDFYGAPVAAYVLKHHPGDYMSTRAASQEYERIPFFTTWGRRRVLHLHDKERTGQSRGRPIVAAVLKDFHMAGKYSTNELQASLTNSLVAAFLESDMDQSESEAVFGASVEDTWKSFVSKKPSVRQTEGAAILPLPPGAKLHSFEPSRPNAAFEAFMLAVLRNIAAGMNLPYELLVKDFSKTNYSSARASLLEAWRYFNGRRRWLSDYWLREVYALWLEEAVNAGEIEAPDFYENKYAYCRARFIFGGRGWVDPVKDATASRMRVEGFVSTLEQECAEQGLDFEEVLDQRALEAAMMRERGLSMPAANGAPAQQPVESSADDSEDPAGNGDGNGDDKPTPAEQDTAA